MSALVLALLAYVLLFPPDPIGGDLALVRSSRPGLRVLFIGNSFTAQNSMITMLRDIGKGDPGAEPIFAVQYAPSGSSLQKAVADSRLTKLLSHERWNHVVLQEQSQLPSRPGTRETLMFPAALTLDAMARQVGARTILFMTWGYKDGDRDAVPGDTYLAMQARLDQGYLTLGASLRSGLAPVSTAWKDALAERPGLDLWQGDGRHPSAKGSYLAACVFYALLLHRDPSRSRFTAGLDPAEAKWLQRIAENAVRRTYGSDDPARPDGAAG